MCKPLGQVLPRNYRHGLPRFSWDTIFHAPYTPQITDCWLCILIVVLALSVQIHHRINQLSLVQS